MRRRDTQGHETRWIAKEDRKAVLSRHGAPRAREGSTGGRTPGASGGRLGRSLAEAVAAKPWPGAPRQVPTAPCQHVLNLRLKGARVYGFPNAL